MTPRYLYESTCSIYLPSNVKLATSLHIWDPSLNTITLVLKMLRLICHRWQYISSLCIKRCNPILDSDISTMYQSVSVRLRIASLRHFNQIQNKMTGSHCSYVMFSKWTMLGEHTHLFIEKDLDEEYPYNYSPFIWQKRYARFHILSNIFEIMSTKHLRISRTKFAIHIYIYGICIKVLSN